MTTVCVICPFRAALPATVTVTRPSFWPGEPPVTNDYCEHHAGFVAWDAEEFFARQGWPGVVVSTPISREG